MNWARACGTPAQAAITASSAVASQAAIRARSEIIMLVPTPSSNLATGKWRTKNEDRRHFQPKTATASKRLTLARHATLKACRPWLWKMREGPRGIASSHIHGVRAGAPASQPAHALREEAGRLNCCTDPTRRRELESPAGIRAVRP
jgi:hypothetical protein